MNGSSVSGNENLFILSFRDVLDPTRIQELDRLADNMIRIRGYDAEAVRVASDLRRPEFFLPVNEVVSDYCPTHRYSYIHKIEGRTPRPTWAGLMGRIIDELYVELFGEIARYASSTSLDKFYLSENLQQYASNAVARARDLIEKRKTQLRDPPNGEKTEVFLKGLAKILRYESELCCALLDHSISFKEDIRLGSEFVLLFPYNMKCKIATSDLGFSGSAEPDFIYSNRVVGDIKTGSWSNSFELTLAAYALAYENETRKKMNLGIIVNPVLTDKRTVPLYIHSGVRIIEDVFRQAVLLSRNRKLEMLMNNRQPPLPEQKDVCQPCGYYDYCWAGGLDA